MCGADVWGGSQFSIDFGAVVYENANSIEFALEIVQTGRCRLNYSVTKLNPL